MPDHAVELMNPGRFWFSQVVSDKKGGEPEEERRGSRPSRQVRGGLFFGCTFRSTFFRQTALQNSYGPQLLISFSNCIQDEGWERADGRKQQQQQQHPSAHGGGQSQVNLLST
jgi:hypothetical protein